MPYERDNIHNMQGYTWGEQPEDEQTLKLNTNENPYPPSPEVQQCLDGLQATNLRVYPPPTADKLRNGIAEHHELKIDNVLITNGGDEALRLALTTFVEPGTPLGFAEPSYSLYPVLAQVQDAPLCPVPLDDDWELPRDCAHQLNEAGSRLVCLVNPHSPSGRLFDVEHVSQLANDFNGVLLLDEAYVDFVDPSLRYDAVRLINAFDNLLILRSFSKGYSLAGLRLGYLLGQASLIDPLISKTRDSYNVNDISQRLGWAAFQDQDYAQECWANVRAARRQLREALAALGLDSPPSQSNFLLATVPYDAKLNAQEVYLALKQRHILLRYFDSQPLEDKLRISIGTPEQNDHLVAELTDLLT